MGTFRVTIEVGDPAGASYREVSALVDTGASYSQILDSILRALGVVPDSRRTFRVADGREVERDVGETRVRLNGSSRMTVVVFGAEDSEAVLGAVTLEDDILLRPPRLTDAEDLFALVDSNRDYLRRWLPWIDTIRSAKDYRPWIDGRVGGMSIGF